jgi:hypothetical protein
VRSALGGVDDALSFHVSLLRMPAPARPVHVLRAAMAQNRDVMMRVNSFSNVLKEDLERTGRWIVPTPGQNALAEEEDDD